MIYYHHLKVQKELASIFQLLFRLSPHAHPSLESVSFGFSAILEIESYHSQSDGKNYNLLERYSSDYVPFLQRIP